MLMAITEDEENIDEDDSETKIFSNGGDYHQLTCTLGLKETKERKPLITVNTPMAKPLFDKNHRNKAKTTKNSTAVMGKCNFLFPNCNTQYELESIDT